ncbi:MAG: Ig-like domain-containing protein [Treponema sp.]|nr:Ig-like domain-containing protein [Treponema sp.]
MFPWRISLSGPAKGAARFFAGLLAVSLEGMFFFSCGFMDLRPIGIRVYPGEPGLLLPGPFTPLVLAFDTPMENLSTERILRVSFNGGQVEGDLNWEENKLSFVPAAPWSAGIGYTLSLLGTVYAEDGRELRLAKYIPFSARSSASQPSLSSFVPSEGASVGITPEDGAYVELNFSLPMDRKTTEDAFSLSGTGDLRFSWRENGRVLRIDTGNPLSPWELYRWTLSDGALSRAGAPLAKSASAWFTTDRDRIFPRVSRTCPMIQKDGTWLDTGGALEDGLGSGLAVGVEFNKPMERASLLRALRFEPSLAGRTEQLSETLIVFIPDRDPEPETVYTLSVSGDTLDAGGLKMGEDYRAHFKTDIPYLRLLSFTADNLASWEGEALQSPLRLPVSAAENGLLRFTLRFSLPFDPPAQLETALRISLEAFFPHKLPPAALRSLYWISVDQLCMEWEGLEAGSGDEAHYYRLTIPGGRNGIGTGRGSYLKEDASLYLEVIK